MGFPFRTALLIGAGCVLAAVMAFIGFRSFSTAVNPQNNFQLLAQVAPSDNIPTSTLKPSARKKKSALAAGVAQSATPQAEATGTQPQAPAVTTPPAVASAPSAGTPPLQRCTFATNQFPSYRKVILNEVAWMGTDSSANNEWLELKNITSEPADISNWQLLDKAEQIKITFPAGSKVPGSGFLLLERGEDAVPSVTAAAVYTGALSNENEGVRLFDEHCFLVDEALADPNWPAGVAETKRSMERAANYSWYTYTGAGVAGIFGTPGKENSTPPAAPAAQAAPATATTTSTQNPAPVEVSSSTPTSTSTEATTTPPVPPPPAPAISHLIISEVMAGTETNADDEFVELYNGTSAEIDLTGFSLKKKTSFGTESNLIGPTTDWFTGKKIAAGARFVIGHAGKFTGTAQTTWPSSYSLAYTNNSVALYDKSGAKVSEVAWTEILPNQSYACGGEPVSCSAQAIPNPGQ